jgi:hypothetical protein
MSEFQDFVRKQFPVQAARVTPMNIEELAEACGGKIMHDGEKENNFSRDYIKVRVAFPLNEEQTKARIGDWLVKQGRTFKVYKDKPFRSTFENRDGTPVPGGNQNRGKGKGKPSPANMPKKVEPKPDPAVADVKQEDIPVPETELPPPTPPTPDPAPQEAPQVIENAEIVSANLVEGPPDPSKGIHPVEIVEKSQKMERDETLEGPSESPAEEVPEVEKMLEEVDAAYPEPEEEKKPITLDELNTHPGDPRTADDIHREGQQG